MASRTVRAIFLLMYVVMMVGELMAIQFRTIMPHSKKESKLDRKDHINTMLPEVLHATKTLDSFLLVVVMDVSR